MVVPSSFQFVFVAQCVERRALDPSTPVEELDQTISAYVNQNPLLLKRAEKALGAFKDNFPLERVEKVLIYFPFCGEGGVFFFSLSFHLSIQKADKTKKRHWRDHFNVPVPLSEVQFE